MKSVLTQILEQADCLYDLKQLDSALSGLAQQLNKAYQDKTPLLLCVMNGAVVTMGQLLPKLTFVLEVDYIHASRYGANITGGELNWYHQPSTELAGRDIILVEDIVDRGDTLAALRQYCLTEKANSVACATLLNKPDVDKQGELAEFIAINIPDRYVFGFGLDY